MLAGGKDHCVRLHHMGRALLLFGDRTAAFVFVISFDNAEFHALGMIRAEDTVKGACFENVHALLLSLFDLLEIGGKLNALFAECQ